MSSETLEELLAKTRRDLEEQIKVDSKLSQELVRLRQNNEALLVSPALFFYKYEMCIDCHIQQEYIFYEKKIFFSNYRTI